MTHVHSLRFEILEARQLLTTHIAMAHGARGCAPFVLNGTLTVDNNPDASFTIRNAEGLATISVPVAGELGTPGQVQGILNQTVDVRGVHVAPDELILRNSKGSFVVAFTVPARSKALGVVSYERAQVVLGGTGAYARASERGSIEVTTKAAGTQVVSLTLQTLNTPGRRDRQTGR